MKTEIPPATRNRMKNHFMIVIVFLILVVIRACDRFPAVHGQRYFMQRLRSEPKSFQRRFCIGFALRGGLAKPRNGFFLIQGYASSRKIAAADRILRHGIAMFGGFEEPLERLRFIFFDAASREITVSERVFRNGVPLFRGFPEPLDGFWWSLT